MSEYKENSGNPFENGDVFGTGNGIDLGSGGEDVFDIFGGGDGSNQNAAEIGGELESGEDITAADDCMPGGFTAEKTKEGGNRVNETFAKGDSVTGCGIAGDIDNSSADDEESENVDSAGSANSENGEAMTGDDGIGDTEKAPIGGIVTDTVGSTPDSGGNTLLSDSGMVGDSAASEDNGITADGGNATQSEGVTADNGNTPKSKAVAADRGNAVKNATAENPLAAALEAAESENAVEKRAGLILKPAVFSYIGANEDILDGNVTFEALRAAKVVDFPELDDEKHVTWTVSYGKIVKTVAKPKEKTVARIKSEIEQSLEFVDSLKKTKGEVSCVVTPNVKTQSKGMEIPFIPRGFDVLPRKGKGKVISVTNLYGIFGKSFVSHGDGQTSTSAVKLIQAENKGVSLGDGQTAPPMARISGIGKQLVSRSVNNEIPFITQKKSAANFADDKAGGNGVNVGAAPYKGIFKTFEEAKASGKAICAVPSDDGKVYEVRFNEIGTFAAKIRNTAGLTGIRAGFTPALPKIPRVIIGQIVSFFRLLSEKEFNVEALANLYWDRQEQKYYVSIPKQAVSKTGVQTVMPDLGAERFLHVADIHSHNTMPAKFSKTDDEDEKATRLYMVVGRLDRVFPKITVRVSCGGVFVEIDPSLVIEEDSISFPAQWLDKVEILGKAAGM